MLDAHDRSKMTEKRSTNSDSNAIFLPYIRQDFLKLMSKNHTTNIFVQFRLSQSYEWFFWIEKIEQNVSEFDQLIFL